MPAAATTAVRITLPVPLLSLNTSQLPSTCSNGSKMATDEGVVAVGRGVGVVVKPGVAVTSGVSVGGMVVAVGPDVAVGGRGVGVDVGVGGIGVAVAVGFGVNVGVTNGVAVAWGVSGIGLGLTINSSAEALN